MERSFVYMLCIEYIYFELYILWPRTYKVQHIFENLFSDFLLIRIIIKQLDFVNSIKISKSSFSQFSLLLTESKEINRSNRASNLSSINICDATAGQNKLSDEKIISYIGINPRKK